MEISVRLGHGLAQHVGSPHVQISLNEGATVADLIGKLSADYPTLNQQLAACVAIVAGSHVNQNEPLSVAQEVALLLPISGGGI
jgi:molybdopterin converting factor small subunit